MELRAEPGCLLAAWPDLQDPNFSHSVVLVVQHTDQGAFGLVLNRPLDATVDQLLPEHPVLGSLSTRVHLGGPVDHTRMQFLHCLGEELPGGHEVVPGLWLGGELEALAAKLSGGGADAEDGSTPGVRLFVGYAGWEAGQLDKELAEGSWVPASFDPTSVFGPTGEPCWRAVVRSVEGGADLASTPPNISWN